MSQIWNFIKEEENRKIIAWVGSGLAVAIAGLWAAYLHFSEPQKPSTTQSNVTASCGSFGAGGNVSGSTITIGNIGNCPSEQKPARP